MTVVRQNSIIHVSHSKHVIFLQSFSGPLVNRMYRVIHNSVTHFIKSLHLNGEEIVTYSLQMERETFKVFFAFLISALAALCDTADVKSIIHLLPYPLQQLKIDL